MRDLIAARRFCRRPGSRLIGCAAAAALLVCAAGVAHATSGRTDMTIAYTTGQPASPTGLKIHLYYKGVTSAQGKPSPIRKLVLTMPAGSAFNLGAVPACHATNNQFMAQGASACPSNSRVGGGTLTIDTGFGPPVDPFVTDVIIFNSGTGFIEYVQKSGVPVTTDRATIVGRTVTETPPAFPGGPPDGQDAVKEVNFTFDVPAYLTTPPACPATGSWTFGGAFTFADGTTDTESASSPCPAWAAATAASPGRKPALAVSVTPRRVVAGRRTTFHVVLASSDPACIRRARVRFAGRTVSHGGRGRFVVTRTFTKASRRFVTAAAAGCGSARAALRVLAPRHPRRPPPPPDWP